MARQKSNKSSNGAPFGELVETAMTDGVQ